MCKIFIFIIVFITFYGCNEKEKVHKNDTSNKENCYNEKFISNDSGGVFTGKLISFKYSSKRAPYRTLSIKDVTGDTLYFKESENGILNLNEEMMNKNNCIIVYYKTEIEKIDGVEVSRFHYATQLEYP